MARHPSRLSTWGAGRGGADGRAVAHATPPCLAVPCPPRSGGPESLPVGATRLLNNLVLRRDRRLTGRVPSPGAAQKKGRKVTIEDLETKVLPTGKKGNIDDRRTNARLQLLPARYTPVLAPRSTHDSFR